MAKKLDPAPRVSQIPSLSAQQLVNRAKARLEELGHQPSDTATSDYTGQIGGFCLACGRGYGILEKQDPPFDGKAFLARCGQPLGNTRPVDTPAAPAPLAVIQEVTALVVTNLNGNAGRKKAPCTCGKYPCRCKQEPAPALAPLPPDRRVAPEAAQEAVPETLEADAEIAEILSHFEIPADPFTEPPAAAPAEPEAPPPVFHCRRGAGAGRRRK